MRPLSLTEHALWIECQRVSASRAYQIPYVLRLSGELNIDALRGALTDVVARHDVLRNGFSWQDGVPVATQRTDVSVPLSVVQGSEEDEERIVDEFVAQPFDLSVPPLLRVLLVRRADGTGLLCVVMHHLVTDGRSREILFADLVARYELHSGLESRPSPEPGMSYGQWAELRRTALECGELDNHRRFWIDRLAEAADNSLSRLTGAPANHEYRGSRIQRSAERPLMVAIRRTAARHRTTMSAALLAVWAATLSRLSGVQQVPVGVVSADRDAQSMNIVGPFAATVPVVVPVDPEGGLAGCFGSVTKATREILGRPVLPLHALTPDGTVPDAWRRAFDVLFVHTHAPSTVRIGPVTATPFNTGTDTAKAPLVLTVVERRDQLLLGLDYSTDRVPAGAAAGILDTFMEILANGVADPVRPLAALGPADAVQATTAKPVTGSSLDELFTDAVKTFPDATAVTAGDTHLSYRELDAKAAAVAGALTELGVGRGQFVGVSLPRSADLIAVLLGVLRANAAYVPLDPAYPADRLRFMAEDAGLSVIVGENGEEFGDSTVVSPEALFKGAPAGPALVGPADPAYVIYTSGSTGRPKGVVVTHGNVLGLMDSAGAVVDAGPQDVWSLFHSFAFDFSVWEIWGALGFGGRLVIVPADTARSPEKFAALLHRERVTVLSQTPTAFDQLVPCLTEQWSVRAVVFGGERLDMSAVRTWRENRAVFRVRLINMYGITETTVHVTAHEVSDADDGSPIGPGLRGTGVRVLDGFGQPVRPGLVGEMFVSGWGVAQGYLNQPRLTAERFIPDPTRHGQRAYRSGDLARLHPNGQLTYIGRTDTQTKIRGYRIELGEIEHTLRTHPHITTCAVLATNGQLIAYTVPTPEHTPTTTQLRNHLATTLAPHMIPGIFVELPQLPMTPNGKLDRSALPAPARQAKADHTPPRTAVEHALAVAWSEVLGMDTVGIHDNFFELGGDSIRAVQVIGALTRSGLAVSLEDVFAAPTIAELADLATGSEPAEPPRPFELLTGEDRDRLPAGLVDAYPMTATQLGMYLQSQLNPGSHIYHNVNSFEIRGEFSAEAFRVAAAAAVARYPVLRTGLHIHGQRVPLQWVHPEAELDIGYVDLSDCTTTHQDQAIGGMIENELADPFDLTRPPLIRFRLVRRGPRHVQVIVTESHLILDGWSFTSLLAEICADHWTVAKTGEAPRRQPLRNSFAAFVRLESAAIRSAPATEFWRTELAEAVPSRLAELAGTAGEPLHISRRVVPVPADVEQGLRDLAARLGVPLKSVLLAAHLRVLAALLGRRDVVTGMVTNGRPEGPDGDRIKGLFLNTVPITARLGDQTWAELTRWVYERERGVLAHRRYPLNQILRDQKVKDLFDVAFHFVEFHELKKLFTGEGLSDVIADGRSSENTHFRLLAAFSVHPPANRLGLVLVHDTATIGHRIEDLAEAYRRALRSLASTPDEPHAGFRFPGAVAPSQARPRTSVDMASRRSLDELFSEVAHAFPDVTAVTGADVTWSYRDLDARVAVVAGCLRRRGVRRGDFVGVCLAKSADLIAVLLGVLRAGAAYVPMDPAYPAERLRFMAEDAGTSLVVTQDASLFPDADTVSPEDLLDGDGTFSAVVGLSDPAYVIYTSGSTGRPKGVVVTHGNVLGLLSSACSAIAFDRWDVWSFFHSFAFDFSVWEIWGALGFGGRLVIVPADTARSPEKFAELLHRERVTILSQTPSAFGQLASRLPAASWLRLVVFGGERLDMAAVRRWRQEPGVESLRLVNMYGITETTVHVTVHDVSDADDGSPIGSALPDAGIHLLDGFGQPVAAGVPGEMFVSGWGVAQGYLNHPRLTAERFIPDPTRHGQRAYRSGDLARLRPNGHLDYIGRADAQVKIRGYRIELGEIEHVLRDHPAVNTCAVLAMDGHLIAYTVPTPGHTPTTTQLRNHLATTLAPHMIPSAFVSVAELPLTPNGKLDRAALPSPAGTRPDGADYAPPESDLERRLAEAWSEVLGVPVVGVHDNFFELGGNSMSAVELAAEAAERTGLDVDMVDVYEHPTIHQLAAHLSRGTNDT